MTSVTPIHADFTHNLSFLDCMMFSVFAAELSPFSAHLYFNRANLNASMGRYESAERDYTKGIQIYQYI